MQPERRGLCLLAGLFLLVAQPAKMAYCGDGDFSFEYEFKLLHADIESLHGIKEIRMSFLTPDDVECLNIHDTASIRANIESNLKGAGISLLPLARWTHWEDSTDSRLPVLTVSADFFEDDYDKTCIYNIDLYFDQEVVVGNRLRMMATTWKNSTYGWVSCGLLAGELGTTVETLVGSFVEDYLFANQEGYVEKSAAARRRVFGPPSEQQPEDSARLK